jgi:hypothetical protein
MLLEGQKADRANDIIKKAEAGFGNFKSLSAILPPGSIAQFIESAQARTISAYVTNFQGGAQVGMGSIGLMSGVLDDAGIKNIGKAVDLDVQDFFNLQNSSIADASVDFLEGRISEGDATKLFKDVGEELVLTGLRVASTAVNVIPIYGQVISAVMKFGLKVYDLIKKIKAANEPPETIYDNLRFSPDQDQYAYENYCVGASRSGDISGSGAAGGDWTKMFSPPTTASIDHRFKYGFTGYKETDGTIRVQPSAANWMIEEGMIGGGFIPGTQHICAAADILENGSVADAGDMLMPSMRQQGIWLWQGYVSPATGDVDPSIFSVNCYELAGRWDRFLNSFRMFLEFERSGVSAHNRLKIINYYAQRDTSGVPIMFGWPGGFIAKTSKVYKTPEFSDPSWVGQTQPMRAIDGLRKQQLAALDTPMCAYVDLRHPAVSGDPDVRAKWEKRRGEFLHSDQRFDMDLRNVLPDPDFKFGSGFYLEQLIESGAGTKKKPKGMEMRLSAAPKSPIPHGTPVAGDTDVGERLISAGKRYKKPLLIAMGAVLLGGGAYAVHRRRGK